MCESPGSAKTYAEARFNGIDPCMPIWTITCIETVMVKGPVNQVREFAEKMMAERGVRHGQLNLVNVELGKPHSHGGSTHRHLNPRH